MILYPITLTFPFSSLCHLCKPQGMVAMNFKELRSHQGLFLLDEILKEEKGCIVEISTLNNELKKCGSYSIFPPFFLKLCSHFECWNVFLMDKDFFLYNEPRKKEITFILKDNLNTKLWNTVTITDSFAIYVCK